MYRFFFISFLLTDLRTHEECINKMQKAFEMMLDFYGMKWDKYILYCIFIRNDKIVKRSERYKERYYNLLNRAHNYLRITRILTSLHIMQMELQAKRLLNHLLWEIFITKELSDARYSCQTYWIKVLPSYSVDEVNKTNIALFLKDDYHRIK